MTDRTFDPNAWMDAYREAFAPVYKAQQESLKTFERFARFHYAVAGDCLESSLAQLQAAAHAKSPAELLTKQAELGTRFGEKLSGRMQEFISLTSEVQGHFAQAASDTAAKAASARRSVAA
jgi:phasin family protein